MSTLNVSNISDGTTTVGTSYVVNGSAKAWVNFNGTGTIAARDSFNTSSLTDIGTGEYSQTFTSSMSNNGYSLTGGISESGVGGQARIVLGDGYTTTASLILSYNTTTRTDYQFIAATLNGDLA